MFKKVVALVFTIMMLFAITTTTNAAATEPELVNTQKIKLTDGRNFFYELPIEEPELYIGKEIIDADYSVTYDAEDGSYNIVFEFTFEDDWVEVGIREMPGEYDLVYRCQSNLMVSFGEGPSYNVRKL